MIAEHAEETFPLLLSARDEWSDDDDDDDDIKDSRSLEAQSIDHLDLSHLDSLVR